MTTQSPFLASADGVDFPDDLPTIDELIRRIREHVARVR
jgi:hypothetical protein